jgi:multiple sugar transport system ATP-binding protein
MASISVKHVTTTNPDRNGRDGSALSDLDLEIQDREFVVLLGPPNSGISSVVRVIAGLDEVAKGDIFIGDRRVNDLAPKARDIALVPQSYVPYPRMSVADNLAFALTLRKLPKAEIKKRVLAAAGLLGLQDSLERKPGSLSGEQGQRVAIARAIALQPKAFLFDRALSTLDPEARARMRHEMVKLHQRLQATMIYATHDPLEAMALGARIIVMNEGVVQQEGTALSLYDEPANVFVAELLAPPMNLVRGTLKQDRDWIVFRESEEGTIELRLPTSKFPGAGDFAGGSVLLGIRPEEIEVAENTKTTEQVSGRFPALIDLVEPVGRGSNLYLQTGAHTLVCRSARQMDPREAGHRSQFALDAGKVRLFDPVSRCRIV